ncbi:MAG: hypothetical protein ACLFVO_20615 [Chloroflexaceae bacterium]
MTYPIYRTGNAAADGIDLLRRSRFVLAAPRLALCTFVLYTGKVHFNYATA